MYNAIHIDDIMSRVEMFYKKHLSKFQNITFDGVIKVDGCALYSSTITFYYTVLIYHGLLKFDFTNAKQFIGLVKDYPNNDMDNYITLVGRYMENLYDNLSRRNVPNPRDVVTYDESNKCIVITDGTKIKEIIHNDFIIYLIATNTMPFVKNGNVSFPGYNIKDPRLVQDM